MNGDGGFLKIPRPRSLFNVKFRIDGIKVSAVQMVLHDPQAFAESLIMYDFSFPQEADGVADLRIFDQTQDIVVGGAGFLLRSHIFEKDP